MLRGKAFRGAMQPALLLLIATLLRALLPQTPAVTDLDGDPVDPLQPRAGIVATALIFLTTDCPIANQTAPEIERLFRDNQRRGVRVWLVFVEPRESAAAIRDHVRAFGLHAPVVHDPGHVLVRQTGVQVTPEAALYLHAGGGPRLTYRGRIDDRAVRLGRQRPRPTTRDLQRAIDQTLSNGPREPVITPAVGCRISDGARSAGTEVPAYD